MFTISKIIFNLVVLAVLVVAAPASAEDLSGGWSGGWVSSTTGHKGPLHAEFTRLDAASYQVDFRGRFFKLFPFRYSVVLNVVEEGDTVRLSGDSYLGRMFGWFHYDAVASGGNFTADYSSCKDQGQFCLTRCCSN
jgi:hypothetical protein